MEIELKYLIPDTEIIDQLWQENVFERYGEAESHGSVEMKAVYYDTEDDVLEKADVAFRIRQEGAITMATLKWNGTQNDSLYEREELDMPLMEPDIFEKPSLEVFAESEKGRELIDLIGDKPLKSKFITEFTRRIMRLDTGDMICELALDTGEIAADNGKSDSICELEIELYSGDINRMTDIGDELAAKFGLIAGTESKYSRGKKLLQK